VRVGDVDQIERGLLHTVSRPAVPTISVEASKPCAIVRDA